MEESRFSRILGFTLVEILVAIGIVGVVATIALPLYEQYRDRARVLQAVNDISMISAAVGQRILDTREAPDSLDEVGFGSALDPWRRPYRYLSLLSKKGKGGARKDKHLNPLNSDFDLYSVGQDGETVAPLPPKVSHDDIIRARDGRFVGLARDFDP